MPADIGSRIAGSSGSEVLVSGAPPETALALAATDADPSWSEGLTLKREADGHFYADVSVDGQNARMLVDTGASVIALTGEDATAMGLSWDEAEVTQVAQGANGPVYGVHTILPHVAMGEFEAADVPALIVPEGLFVSLLGQSFLSKIKKVEIAGDNLVMSS